MQKDSKVKKVVPDFGNRWIVKTKQFCQQQDSDESEDEEQC